MVLWGKVPGFMPGIEAPIHLLEQLQEKPVLEGLDDQQHGVLRWKQTDDQNLFPLPSTGTDVLGTLYGTDAK